MYLTPEEDRILNGDPSLAITKAMGILVNYGELQEAKRLIPIKNAHVSGVSYLTAGEALVKFLEDFVRGKGKAVVPSTLNPAGMDMDRWSGMGIPPEFPEKGRGPRTSPAGSPDSPSSPRRRAPTGTPWSNVSC